MQTSISKLQEIDRKHILHPTTVPSVNAQEGPKIIFSRGEGVRVRDINEKNYIDGVSMLWNVNVGHGNEELASAAYEQMTAFAYGSQFYGFSNEPAIKLAEKLGEWAPGDLNNVFYTSGGSESNDTAFKLARFYWQKKGFTNKKIIISLTRGYHGVTVGAQRATGIEAFRDFSGSGDPNIYNAKAHLTNAEKGDTSDQNYASSVRSMIEELGSEQVAAVILEPIQGAGGVHMPPDGYLEAIRQLCDEKSVLMISDEIICGFGRTGKNFGVDHWGVIPDMICFAKGITSGYFPLGGVLMSDAIKSTIDQHEDVLAHGFTYSGHPSACAVGLKNLEILERENILENVISMEKVLTDGLKYLENKHKYVTKIRNKGLLAGFELMKDPENGIPFESPIQASSKLVEKCLSHHLIIRPFDFEEGMNIIAIAPPLIINEKEINEIIDIIDTSLTELESEWNDL
ncbi:aspartate aminotransferase family protein [Marinococcus halophilus]|uniref:Aspartate aminotransferase family protein n=1 Tax=Marinococcus halophilus TaxID=1371 RepID=A0A510Y999_MARHA|nr:aspartate aminotransferase family protein [Marinococcus halophilus]OZT79087.1 aspartate aminotransferase family protein [Marinococcus halophilus]GEK59929.1 aspartate aminotransferase family protein [Marinococcus halophilus]